ncbi:vacuolar protein-sorting-associated protein [Ophiostoma piceae UAMH 11346]|uniref:ESCRT-II complex subunit VPS25 n=1 Tax=Ophiostoma piceae (strain UAMH 11346) TaxID=1262450 RepID=S3CC67_OPHP1|nr:vacuolar protein-sorting-associated protein [Ophiostoma piceae UAMH 11346]
MAQDTRLPVPGTASPSQIIPDASFASSSSSLPQQPSAASPSDSSSSFTFPQYYSFPPMFTLQPNLNTRRAQLDKWSALVLAYCRHYRIFRLIVGGGPPDATGPARVDSSMSGIADDDDMPSVAYYAPDLFRNRNIDRAMPPSEIRQVLDDMKRQGRIEFVDQPQKGAATDSVSSSFYVFWKTPEEWAAAVEAFVDDTAQRGSVLTLYELTAGDATRGSELHGLDPVVLQRALAVLVKRGKAQVFGQEESLGVKFF